MWALSLRKGQRANQNTTSTLESYHGALKRKLQVSKQQLRGREITWLYHSLTRVVLAAYQHDALLKNVRHWLCGVLKSLMCTDAAFIHGNLTLICSSQLGKKRNEKAEQRATAAILAARDIPDECITMDDGEACAYVTSSRSMNTDSDVPLR